MAVELYMRRVGTDLKPVDELSTQEMMELKSSQVYRCELKQPRNYEFHKKFFALLNFAFEHWDCQPTINRYGQVEKNFDQFREDITIKAGYYEQHWRLDGTFRVVAKSISFANMGEVEFSKLYKSACNVVIKHVLANYTLDDLEQALVEAERFAA